MTKYCSTRPKEVYRDKHTLVEVTIHRNPKAETSKQESRRICPESLSDSETQFRKPRARSGQDGSRRDRSRGARVPNKENVQSKSASKIQRLCERPDCSEFTKKIHELEFSLEKSKLEATRYRKEYNVMVSEGFITMYREEKVFVVNCETHVFIYSPLHKFLRIS